MTTTPAPLPAERRRRGRITRADRADFLEALAAGWAVRHAATRTRHGFQRWYELRDEDEDFAAAWSDAIEQGTQRLEDEALRRAVDGYDENTYDGEGVLTRRVRRYDGALLQTLLKGRRPEVYRDGASLEVKNPVVFVLDSAFARPGIDVVQAELPALAHASQNVSTTSAPTRTRTASQSRKPPGPPRKRIDRM